MNSRTMQLAAALAVAGIATLGAQNAVAQGRPLSTTLTGAAEVPGPGDPDGSGEAFLTLNHGQGQICYQISVTDIAAATAAHIHIGAVGEAGPVVVGLNAPVGGSSSGCATVDRELIKAIMHDPDFFYVNVHNATFPAGAVRGQLSK